MKGGGVNATGTRDDKDEEERHETCKWKGSEHKGEIRQTRPIKIMFDMVFLSNRIPEQNSREEF